MCDHRRLLILYSPTTSRKLQAKPNYRHFIISKLTRRLPGLEVFKGLWFSKDPLGAKQGTNPPFFLRLHSFIYSPALPFGHLSVLFPIILSISIHPSFRPPLRTHPPIHVLTHPPIHSATCMHSITSSHNAQSLQSRGAFSKSNLQSRIKCCFQGDGCMEEWIERWMNRKMDGWMDGKQMKGRKGPRGYQGNQDSMTTWQPFFMFGYLKCSAILYWKLILVTRQMMARK